MTSPVTTLDADRKRYALGNVLCIDTLNAPSHIGKWLTSAVGLRFDPAGEPAALTVRFVEKLAPTRFQRLDVNGDTFAFDADDFFLVDRKGARARLNFDGLDVGEELTCEMDWSFDESILRDLLAVLALARGWLMLHGSAFEYGGLGVLVTGWQASGKSEFLLGMRGAARYISDEPTLVHGATGRIVSSPALLPLWDWQIQQLECEGELTPEGRGRVRMARALRRLLPEPRGDSIPARGLARLHRKLKTITRVPVPPERIFRVVEAHEQITADVVITGSIGEPEVRRMTGETLAKKMALSQRYERRSLTHRYYQFRHAFPERRSDLMEGASERELALLTRLLRPRTVLDIVHPYPGKLAEHGALARRAIDDAMESSYESRGVGVVPSDPHQISRADRAVHVRHST
jgi:hypothetical protein